MSSRDTCGSELSTVQYAQATGNVLAFAAGVEHSAHSDGGEVFLLTVVHLEPVAAD